MQYVIFLKCHSYICYFLGNWLYFYCGVAACVMQKLYFLVYYL